VGTHLARRRATRCPARAAKPGHLRRWASPQTALELADRIAILDEDLTQLDAAIYRRQTNFWQLAHQVRTFVDEQQALARAQAAIRDADQRRGISLTTSDAHPTGALADHTAAILAAYRELIQQPAAESIRPEQ
jgi:hypothetical protein